MKPNSYLKVLLGTLLFIFLEVGTTYYLQTSLVVFQLLGPLAHFAIILYIMPLIIGFIIHLLEIHYKALTLIIGGTVSAIILYSIYLQKGLWAVPPNIFQVIVFTFIIIGIAYLPNLPLRQVMSNIWRRFKEHQIRIKKNRDTLVNQIDSSNERVDVKVPLNSPPKTTSSIEMYKLILKTIKVLIALIALIMGIITTFFLK